MGSNFVEIKTSVTDIVRIAGDLRDQGDQMETSMRGATEQVTTLENHGETFPRDQFTEPFLEKYHAPTDTGDGGSAPANQALKDNVIGLGGALRNIGDSVQTAMWSYAGTDDENEGDIRSTST